MIVERFLCLGNVSYNFWPLLECWIIPNNSEALSIRWGSLHGQVAAELGLNITSAWVMVGQSAMSPHGVWWCSPIQYQCDCCVYYQCVKYLPVTVLRVECDPEVNCAKTVKNTDCSVAIFGEEVFNPFAGKLSVTVQSKQWTRELKIKYKKEIFSCDCFTSNTRGLLARNECRRNFFLTFKKDCKSAVIFHLSQRHFFSCQHTYSSMLPTISCVWYFMIRQKSEFSKQAW